MQLPRKEVGLIGCKASTSGSVPSVTRSGPL